MIGHDEASQQAETLQIAAAGSPVRQLRYELKRRAREWERAADELEACDGEGSIELVGSIGAGMYALGRANNGNDIWWPVVRVMTRDGQTSLHLEDPDGRPVYLNFFGPSSPVVVRS